MGVDGDGLEKFNHGGDRISAAERYGLPPDRFLDFSANINPLGLPPKGAEALEEAIRKIDRYPDPGKRAITRRLSSYHQIEETHILVGNGAAELLSLLYQTFRPRKVGLLSPSFVEYEEMARIYGAEIIRYSALEEKGFRPNPAEMLPFFKGSDMVLLGSPNNPTGYAFTRDELLQLVSWSREEKIPIVLDEAFIDFLPIEDRDFSIALLHSNDKLLTLRSMTKIFAIPGLRLGYVISSPAMIRQMRTYQVPWSVNIIAQEVGVACLKEEAFLEETRALIRRERQYLQASISSLLGWRVYPSSANYLLVRIEEPFSARSLQDVLGRRGILIRNADSYVGLTPFHFRIAVRLRHENERLVREMARARDFLLSRQDEEREPTHR